MLNENYAYPLSMRPDSLYMLVLYKSFIYLLTYLPDFDTVVSNKIYTLNSVLVMF